MPSRIVSLVILVYWSIAAFCLLTWDVLPEMTSGYPPDLRTITQAVDSGRPVRWSIQVTDDPRFPDVRRIVGEAVTACARQAGRAGSLELTSRGRWRRRRRTFEGTAFLIRSSIELEIGSRYLVDRSGNLHSFRLEVKSPDSPETLVEVKGEVKGKAMEVVSRGPVDILNKKMTIGYEPKSVIQDVLGPLDRLPGLHVGQRWESQVINPFTGQVSPCESRGQPQRKGFIQLERQLREWTFEVVATHGPP